MTHPSVRTSNHVIRWKNTMSRWLCCILLSLSGCVLAADLRRYQPKDVYEGCGTSKGCYGMPGGCVEIGQCFWLATYAASGQSEMDVEIYGHAVNQLTNHFTALGFSGDNHMGDDCVAECVVYRDEVRVFLSRNDGYRNVRQPQIAVDVLETRIEGDSVYCHVRLDRALTVGNLTCDLGAPHHLLFATGASTIGHTFSSHRLSIASDVPVDLGATTIN